MVWQNAILRRDLPDATIRRHQMASSSFSSARRYCILPQPQLVPMLLYPSLLIASWLSTGAWAAPMACPSDPAIVGYTDLKTLTVDIGDFNGTDGDFILCPQTTFVANCINGSDLFLQGNGTKVLCGPNGSVDDNCTITTDRNSCPLVFVSDTANNVLVKGITVDPTAGGLTEAMRSEIAAMTPNSTSTFEDCVWKNVVMAPSPFRSIIRVSQSSLTLISNIFQTNTAKSLVEVLTGTLSVARLSSNCNILQESPIQTFEPDGGPLSVTDSCFVENAYSFGAVYADRRISNVTQTNNYIRDSVPSEPNEGAIPCNGVYQSTLENSKGFTCDNFTAVACAFGSSSFITCPTTSPTVAPTTPTDAPSAGYQPAKNGGNLVAIGLVVVAVMMW